MRSTRDTFLHFLSDNLAGYTIHPIRRDADNPDGEVNQMNAINVKFLNSDFSWQIGKQLVVLTICNENELAALDMAQAVFNLLKLRFYTPKFDYSSGSPVATGDCIYWEQTISFRTIHSPLYFQFVCNLTLQHHPQ